MNSIQSEATRLDILAHLMRAAAPMASLQQHMEGRARLIASVEEMRRRSRLSPGQSSRSPAS
jgi:hypothetical protein